MTEQTNKIPQKASLAQSDDTYDLICSLTASEKRFFTLYAQRHTRNRQTKYLQLFEILESMPVYNEAALFEKITDKKARKNISVTKNYLSVLIVESLCSFHRSENITLHINELINSAKILITKNHFKQADTYLHKAYILANDNNLHAEQFIIIKTRLGLLWDWGTTSIPRIQEFQHELRTITNFLIREQELLTTNYLLGSISQQYGSIAITYHSVTEMLSKYVDVDNLHQHVVESNRLELLRLTTLALYNWIQGDLPQSLVYYNQAYSLFANTPEFIPRNINQYFHIHLVLAMTHLRLGQTEKVFYYTQELRAISSKYTFPLTPNLVRYIDLSVKVDLDTKLRTINISVEELLEMWDEFTKYLAKRSNDKVFISLISSSLCNMAIILTNKESYNNALDILSKIWIIDLAKIRSDVILNSRICEAVCLFELHDFGVLADRIRSLERFKTKHQINDPALTNFLFMMKKIIVNESDLSKQRKAFTMFYQKTEEVFDTIPEAIKNINVIYNWMCNQKIRLGL